MEGAFNLTPGTYIDVMKLSICYRYFMGFPGGTGIQNLPANPGATGDAGSMLGSGRFPGGETDYPLQYSCLENPQYTGS